MAKYEIREFINIKECNLFLKENHEFIEKVHLYPLSCGSGLKLPRYILLIKTLEKPSFSGHKKLK
jgi:hypothetical protein